MPSIPNGRIMDHRADPMPSRVTSAFHNTVIHNLLQYAFDYTTFIASQGADPTTVHNYVDSLHVFPSHFREWAGDMTRDAIIASIPVLRSLLPGITSGIDHKDNCPPKELTPLISLVLTLAVQQFIVKGKNPYELYYKGYLKERYYSDKVTMYEALDPRGIR